MTETIIATLISALLSATAAITVCVINNKSQREAAERQHNTTIELIEYKLDQLTHKVELHNNAVERLTKLEAKVDVDEEKIRVANHRLDDLEKG